jgi:Flp pilus assembly protein TadG
MSPIQPPHRFASRLVHNQRGSVALTFLLTSALMIGGTLGAIDLVRYNIAESRLQNAVDATGISAGQALTAWDPAINSDKTAWQNYASAVFTANLPNHYQNSDITASNITSGIQYCTSDSTGVISCPSAAPAGTPISAQYVNINVQGSMPLLSTGFLGRPSFTLLANNQVIRRLKNNSEIVLALEDSSYTGTNNGKIQDAAKSLVSAALGAMDANQQSSAQGIRVGVVPFSALVRMNPDGSTPNSRNWVKTVATTLGVESYVQNSNHWLGCITEPFPPVEGYYWGNGGNPALPAAKRTPPDPNNAADPNSFQPAFMPIPATSKGTKSTLGVFVSDNPFTVTQLSSTNTLTATTVQFHQNDLDPNKSPLVAPRAPNAGRITSDTLDYRFIGLDAGSNWGNVAPAVYSAFEPDSCAYLGRTQFLSQNTATLNAAIDTMQGWQHSESLIAGGLLWSWRMLAPTWSSDTAGTGRGWDDALADLPADPANTDPNKAMVQNRAIVLVSTGMNSTASDTGYRAPQMYTGTPTQQSVFQMVVNYCSNKTPPTINTVGVATGCASGTFETGVVTTPTSTLITANSSIGNRGGVNNPQDKISDIGIWPATSLVNLDMRSPAAIVSAFAGYGSKLVGQNTFSSFQDTNASIGWPAGTTTGLTSADATAYMQAVCTAIKNDSSTYPIRIYTVFVGSSGSTNQTEVANCASGPAYVFTNYDSNNLKSSFAAILGSMTELRLTK